MKGVRLVSYLRVITPAVWRKGISMVKNRRSKIIKILKKVLWFIVNYLKLFLIPFVFLFMIAILLYKGTVWLFKFAEGKLRKNEV